MSVTEAELQAFHRFLGEQLRSGNSALSPEQSVVAFRAWQRDVQRLRDDLQEALEQSERGESRPVDAEELKRRVRDRLARAGIE